MKKPGRTKTEFSRRLKELRTERDFTMDEMCLRYNEACGGTLNKSTLSRYENGGQEPMMTTVASLASFFGVSPNYLIGDSDQRDGSANAVPAARQLSDEEWAMVVSYRMASADDRAIVDLTLKKYAVKGAVEKMA